MNLATTLLFVVTSADPAATCADRACLIAAAKECNPASGLLETADLANLAKTFGVTIKGTTAVSVKKGPAEACTMLLTVHLEEVSGATKDQVKLANTDVKNRLQCEGTPAQLARLVEILGTEAIKARDMGLCFTTKCDPAPTLAKGCKAGPCVRGGYTIKCGARSCQMTGLPGETNSKIPSFPQEYSCGEQPGSIQAASPPPKKKR